MCGIAGFVDKRAARSETEKKQILAAMLCRIEHRGRDAKGMHVDGMVAMAQTRLSIIDVSERGTQPFYDDERTIAVVYNGEIYNYESVNKRIAESHRLVSSCDTETLVYSYKDSSSDFLNPLKGMWAFSIHDMKRDQIVLSVDRFGIKPLYYLETDQWFAWSSEIKAFWELPGWSPAFDPSALVEQLRFRHVAGSHTLLQGVRRVLPGEMLTFDLASRITEQKSYWTLSAYTLKRNGARDQLSALLQQSVQEHLVADVPVALQLSGGVDSSLVAAIASQKKRGLHTYSIGLAEEGWNEFEYSRYVAERYHTVHKEILFTEDDFAALMPRLTYMLDEPVGHSHTIPMFILAREARKDVKVLLSGEGADEVFLGYRRYAELLSRNLSADDILFSNAFNSADAVEMVTPHTTAQYAYRSEVIHTPGISGQERLLSLYDIATYLPPLLLRQDKMGMAANLENRVPFLDHQLVEFGFSLPVEEKMRDGEAKAILKDVASAYLPHDLIYRRKCGFAQPISEWLRHPRGLGRYLTLFDKGVLPGIDYDAVRELSVAHQKGENNGDMLWTLLGLEMWAHVCLQQESPENVLSQL